MTAPNGINGTPLTVHYPAFLTEDAPRPPDNQRSIEPPQRIDLLVDCITHLTNEGTHLPIPIGQLFVLTNRLLQARGREREVFGFVEFKAVVRCCVLDGGRGFAVRDGRLVRSEERMEEEEVVREIRVAMEGVEEVGRVSVGV
ncbi:hypothetical protein M409DRAFT_18094 [Zasmidium cellare ATCC 36951]|uniref:Uncharacterized protein n=1 Tax=Zasmidium cellare ATCC 36951 TaxID=1080233 RepID=A0A6A6D130_ZASCE|nr:uncharacterized protein M409DRAFT_18094 [Zasmidium cellare ATCC 36951]KAF2171862.1 hypothetical protein M409DRAFT_18094 [Zasmidium cellare ATCC 36951]